uniref:Uncharacterized protein n=1 Tax=Ditylenchus dipsaci TaxID=166011 RepID=A0A915DD73_9BILA
MVSGIPVLQRAVNDFDTNAMPMSLARVTEAAYSKRWDQPTSLRNGEQQEGSVPQQQVVINVPGINLNLANRQRGWFNAPVIQRRAPRPPGSGGFNQDRNRV